MFTFSLSLSLSFISPSVVIAISAFPLLCAGIKRSLSLSLSVSIGGLPLIRRTLYDGWRRSQIWRKENKNGYTAETDKLLSAVIVAHKCVTKATTIINVSLSDPTAPLPAKKGKTMMRLRTNGRTEGGLYGGRGRRRQGGNHGVLYCFPSLSGV